MSAPADTHKTDEKPVILTCVQPTGKLHLGNYLGAVRNWVGYQDGYECFFGLADLHAITVFQEPAALRRSTLECAAIYLACGLDPKRARIFVQSHVIGHTELGWVLACLCPLGQLERMTQFKDKMQKQQQVGSGLLFYPTLMAADILLYNAKAVPVGEDQKQHLEITRDLAQKFNTTYSPTFNVPEPFIHKEAARIYSLQSPGKKMSKSDPDQNGTLYLLDTPEALRKKVMSAVTDSGNEVRFAQDKLGVSNLLVIMSVATGTPIPELEARFNGQGYGDFKKAVADAVVDMLSPIRERYESLVADKDGLLAILKDGADAAQKVAYKTLSKVYRKVGLLERPR